jgi:ABC-type uncharacterized transport system involved in gliding motility auxiliary subunit
MKNPKLLTQQLLSGLLFVAILGLLGWLSVSHNLKIDWTANKLNTLTEGSVKQLESMKDPIRFVSFSYQGGEDRGQVEAFVDKYQRFKKDVTLEFIDPSAQPRKVTEYNVSYAGQAFVEYQGRREALSTLNEQTVTAALQRLAFTGEKWIVFLTGHGERSIDDPQNLQGYAQFAQVLRDKGLKVQSVNLIETPKIPDNTSALVIASPKKALLDGEIKLIDEYVQQGGNLLWLADPDNPPGLDALAKSLGVQWQNGYAILPEYQMLGTGDPRLFVAVSYPPGPVTQGMDQVTVFPLARSLTAKPEAGWQDTPMLESSPQAWLEASEIGEDGVVSLDPKTGDIPGPLTLGLTLTRDRPGATPAPAAEGQPPAVPEQQRVALIGDADFLSDAYLGQLGNQQLGLNILQWLAARDSQINIDVPKAPDTSLYLSNTWLAVIALGFVIVLPLLLLGIGIGRWATRRRR